MVGIDFGTTNSSIALADDQGRVRLLQVPAAGGLTATYRSLLYLEQTKTKSRSQLHSWSGPEGIERYLAAEPKGRLIQSLKSYLSSRTLTGTEVFGRQQLLEDLVARILADLRKHAESYFGRSITAATVGRPVHFVAPALMPMMSSRWNVSAMHSQEPALRTWSSSLNPLLRPITTLRL